MKYEVNQTDLDKIFEGFLSLEESILKVHNIVEDQKEKIPLLDKLCGNWECRPAKSEFLLYKEHASYRLLLIRDNGFLNETQINTLLIMEDKDYPYIMVNGDILNLVYDLERGTIRLSPFEQYFKKKEELEEPEIFINTIN